MFRRLLQITAAGHPGKFLNHDIDRVIRNDALFCLHPHPFQDLRKRKSREDNLLFFRRIIRNIDNRESAHQRSADPRLVVCRRDRIDASRWNHALDVVVGISQIIQKCQQSVRRICAGIPLICLIQLIDDEDNIVGACSRERLHDQPRFRVRVNSRTSGQCLRIRYRTHIQ